MRTVRAKDGKTIAIIVSHADYFMTEDKNFYTDNEDSLQVGSLPFTIGSRVAPHLHKQKESTSQPMEVLFVLYGVVSAEFYDDKKSVIETTLLRTGDIVIQKSGGHGFYFNDRSRLLEIKTGPYLGKDIDKEMI